jgi:Chalcone isomerase-like
MRRLAWTILLFCLAAPAAAGSLAGVSMPEGASVSGQDLVLNGMALRKKFFVKVYVAGLYLPAKATAAEAVLGSDGPRRMVMHWVYGVGKEKICEGWDEGLAANTPNASAELRGDFERLCALMADADKGDEFVFTYLPGTGTEVAVKGESKGTIEGKAFADALLACWIGPKPGPGEDFKAALLGGS